MSLIADETGAHRQHVSLGMSRTLCVQPPDLGFCLFLCLPSRSLCFCQDQYQSWCQPAGPESIPCQQEAGEEVPTPPPSHMAASPLPTALPGPAVVSGKDMFPRQGLQQPLHFGLEFHNGLTGTWVFLWSGQEAGKEKGV